MEFKSLIEQALAIRSKCAEFENERYGREWSREELMLGYMKDVGDLAQLVQAKEGVRRVIAANESLAKSRIIWIAECDHDVTSRAYIAAASTVAVQFLYPKLKLLKLIFL